MTKRLKTSRRTPWMAKLALAACSVLAVLLLFEVALRIFLPQSEYAIILAPWGFTHKPNARITYRWRGHKVPVEYNSKGLRGPEYSYEKPKGVFRILILGDSFAEDMASFYENLFSTRLKKMLNGMYRNPRFEVINAGHFAFDNAQELMFYLKEGRKYRPDLVIVLHALDRASTRFATEQEGVLQLHYQQFTWKQHMARWAITWVRMNSHFGSFVLDKLRDLKSSSGIMASLRVRLTREGTEKIETVGSKKPETADAFPLGRGPDAQPLMVFPPDHPNVAHLPEKLKKELRARGVIRAEAGKMPELDRHVWKHFGEEAARDGADLVILQIWDNSLRLTPKELEEMKLKAYNLGASSFWTNDGYAKAAAERIYDPRLDSHRWGYDGNRKVAQRILELLQQGGHLPPREGSPSSSPSRQSGG